MAGPFTHSSTDQQTLSLSPGPHNLWSKISQSGDWNHRSKRRLPWTGHLERGIHWSGGSPND
jgi:hypothetical protein